MEAFGSELKPRERLSAARVGSARRRATPGRLALPACKPPALAVRMPLARAAKRLKRLKTAMGGSWKKLAWIWVRRHVRLGLAPRRLGIDGAMPTINAMSARFIFAFLQICAMGAFSSPKCRVRRAWIVGPLRSCVDGRGPKPAPGGTRRVAANNGSQFGFACKPLNSLELRKNKLGLRFPGLGFSFPWI